MNKPTIHFLSDTELHFIKNDSDAISSVIKSDSLISVKDPSELIVGRWYFIDKSGEKGKVKYLRDGNWFENEDATEVMFGQIYFSNGYIKHIGFMKIKTVINIIEIENEKEINGNMKTNVITINDKGIIGMFNMYKD